MIWLISFLILVIAEVLLFVYLPEGNYREIILIIIGAFIGAIGFSIKDHYIEYRTKKVRKKRYKDVLSRFTSFFGNSFTINNETLKVEGEYNNEAQIVDDILQNIAESNKELHNGIKLCYFCKKWETSKDAEDYEKIKSISESLGLSYANIDTTVKKFLNTYKNLILDKVDLTEKINISDKKYTVILKSFVSKYYKDLQFFEIKDKFHQNKNLHDTLIKIIKEGKLSNYGISEETIKRLKKDLNRRTENSNVFLILANNSSPDDRKSWKSFLKKFGRLGGVGTMAQMPLSGSKWQVYILKITKNYSAKDLLKEIKNSVIISSEAIVEIVPLNFSADETYTLPFNQSFQNANLKKSYDVIEWFKAGYDYSDSALWSEITKSNITPEELLTIIPFNIFCQGILPSEQEFIILNYQAIKEKANVNTLNDWKDVDKDLLVSYMLEHGHPEYSENELNLKLKIVDESKKDEKIKARLLKIADQIKKGAESFYKSLNPIGLEG